MKHYFENPYGSTEHKCSSPTHPNQVLAINCCADVDGFNCQNLSANNSLNSSSSSSSLQKQQNQIKKHTVLPFWNAMELNFSFICTLLLLLLLFRPGFSTGRMHGKNMGSEVYEIDYRGPETHTYIPPPNRAGPRVPHQTATARRKSKRHVRRNLVRKNNSKS